MINVDILAIEKLLEFVKEGNEVHMEYEPDRTVIEIMPWKPITYNCPFKILKEVIKMRLPSGWIFIPRMKDRVTIEVEQEELVTCKDCKYFGANDFPYTLCHRTTMAVDEEDYCSYAWRENR